MPTFRNIITTLSMIIISTLLHFSEDYRLLRFLSMIVQRCDISRRRLFLDVADTLMMLSERGCFFLLQLHYWWNIFFIIWDERWCKDYAAGRKILSYVTFRVSFHENISFAKYRRLMPISWGWTFFFIDDISPMIDVRGSFDDISWAALFHYR